MKQILNLAIAAAVIFGATFPAHGQDLDACVVDALEGSAGTVDSVREIPLPRDIHAFDPGVLEHSVRPETAEQLVVRLDAGPLVVFSQRQSRAFKAGQRVRVRLDGSVAAVEPQSAC